ncbi:hypothetical protein J2S74_002858 [Evansella vedderi]|uniref:Uncharacterized protein n=1 Tax=Evansella vedderi TaxID=38282 RepID=A0ABT9ZXL9_9BACI|nr:hypothetical protein [Evansella vedderi]MDQ0255476.1 hypothetical protein [Evansella vedderi]
MEKITFKDVANSMGLSEESCRISMSLPPVAEEVANYRVFCLAEMLVNRAKPTIKKVTYNQWAEVRKVFLYTTDTFIAVVQFNGSPQTFPLKIPMSAIMGHPSHVVMNARKIERELDDQLKGWSKVTLNGMRKFSNIVEVLHAMQNLKGNKEKKKVS